MNQELAKSFMEQLDALIQEFVSQRSRCEGQSFSYMDGPIRQSLVARARAAVDRIARGSVYHKQTEELFKIEVRDYFQAPILLGILEGLRSDLAAGYLKSFAELVHADVFTDFLEMAQYLKNEGYKDAAAVIAGSSLEAHLLQMCHKHEIPIEYADSSENWRPKKAERINSDLAGADVYSKGDQKNVTAWLDLRNNAAHANYDKYTRDQVALMIDGIRDFITRNPA